MTLLIKPKGTVIIFASFLFIALSFNCAKTDTVATSTPVYPVVAGTGLTVSTIAGAAMGTVAFGDTDATGTLARFNKPTGIATDGTNLYIAEEGNNKIRKMVIATGVVTTLAGPAQGTTTLGNADGTGGAARFYKPAGLATDGTNLYVADRSNNKIRKIVIATGVVTTIAGPAAGTTTFGDTDATGNAARFRNPNGLALSGTNDLYITDQLNNKIRKMNLTTGVVTTIAGPAQGTTTGGDTDGTGNAARFFAPYGIFSDGTNLYVADRSNHKIRKIVIATGVVTTMAGPAQGTTTFGDADGTGSAARFHFPTGIVGDGTNLYITSSNANKIRQIVIATSVVTTIAGPAAGTTTSGDTDAQGNSARFFTPYGITATNSKIYVSEFSNHKIRLIQ